MHEMVRKASCSTPSLEPLVPGIGESHEEPLTKGTAGWNAARLLPPEEQRLMETDHFPGHGGCCRHPMLPGRPLRGNSQASSKAGIYQHTRG